MRSWIDAGDEDAAWGAAAAGKLAGRDEEGRVGFGPGDEDAASVLQPPASSLASTTRWVRASGRAPFVAAVPYASPAKHRGLVRRLIGETERELPADGDGESISRARKKNLARREGISTVDPARGKNRFL
jgi:hypothetical protein